jgi:hypothetical protein
VPKITENSKENFIEALQALDIPVVVARELARVHGDMIWRLIVGNPYAPAAAVVAAETLLKGGDGCDAHICVARAMSLNIPGVCRVAATEQRTPGWMIRWMLEQGHLSPEEE